jgi:hypothetical protein
MLWHGQSRLLRPLDEIVHLQYLQIYRVAVKVVGDMLNVDQKLRRGDKSITRDYCIFTMQNSTTESSLIALRFEDGTEFGLLNTHTSQVLGELIGRPSVQFEAVGSTLIILETIGKATKSADAVVRVNINVYGPSDAKKEIGSHLSKHRVYLQRPDKPRSGSIYENPHFLRFDDMRISSLEYQSKVAPLSVPTSNNADDLQKTISDVYSSLKRGTKLNQLSGDRRIATPLLP